MPLLVSPCEPEYTKCPNGACVLTLSLSFRQFVLANSNFPCTRDWTCSSNLFNIFTTADKTKFNVPADSWARRLPPGKEVQLRYGYSVAYPEDRKVQALSSIIGNPGEYRAGVGAPAAAAKSSR
jgi:hypothetical protein